MRRGCLTVGAALPGSLIVVWAQLAIAFVLRHPAVTCAIIGPRTMEHLQSQLPAAEVTLTDDVLGRMDEIVAPGVTINPADGVWVSAALEPTARRRQDAGSRSGPGRRACLRESTLRLRYRSSGSGARPTTKPTIGLPRRTAALDRQLAGTAGD